MSAPLTPASCLNCDQPLAAPGRFCPGCGQAPAHRLSTAQVLHEIAHVFTHADKGILAFVPLVLLRPGRLVADYLAGRRKRHFNPFQYLLIVVGLATAATALLKYYEATATSMQQRYAANFSAGQLTRIGEYFHFVGKYYNLWWLLLLLPVYAAFTWLVYRRRGLNYAEAFFVQVVTGAVFHTCLLVLLLSIWLFYKKELPGSNIASLLQIGTLLGSLVLIGRQGLGLSWGGAGWRALLVVVLGSFYGFALNFVAFRWYVGGG